MKERIVELKDGRRGALLAKTLTARGMQLPTRRRNAERRHIRLNGTTLLSKRYAFW